MDSIGTAFYIWTYPYVVYSNTDWLLHIDSNSKANMCEKRCITVLSDSMDSIQIPAALSDRYVSSGYNPGKDRQPWPGYPCW